MKKIRHFLTQEERETIISWNDNDKDRIFIYSSQQPMIRRLLKNKLFKLKEKHLNRGYAVYPAPISVEGYLPRRALTIRTKFAKKRILSNKEKKELRRRLTKCD